LSDVSRDYRKFQEILQIEERGFQVLGLLKLEKELLYLFLVSLVAGLILLDFVDGRSGNHLVSDFNINFYLNLQIKTSTIKIKNLKF